MPTAVKKTENMAKHLTQSEIAAREAAEAAFLPDRNPGKPPKAIRGDKLARQIWKDTLQRMEGLGIIDVLDSDTLAIYCSMVSRRQMLVDKLAGVDDILSAAGQVVFDKDLRETRKEIQSLENSILAYAGKLGLTPDSRARLAKRAAEQEEEGEDADLFA